MIAVLGLTVLPIMCKAIISTHISTSVPQQHGKICFNTYTCLFRCLSLAVHVCALQCVLLNCVAGMRQACMCVVLHACLLQCMLAHGNACLSVTMLHACMYVILHACLLQCMPVHAYACLLIARHASLLQFMLAYACLLIAMHARFFYCMYLQTSPGPAL